MTRKEIIDGLKFTVDMFLFDPTTGETFTEPRNDMDKTTIDACKGAIELLEQTDGDLISRKAVLDCIGMTSLHYDLARRLRKLPTIPQTDSVLEDIKAEIEKLPRIKVGNSNSPTVKYCIDEVLLYDLLERYKAEKTAEWIFWTSKSAKCSNCGHIQFTNGEDTTKNTLIHKALYHYCPNCGAKMKEGDTK